MISSFGASSGVSPVVLSIVLKALGERGDIVITDSFQKRAGDLQSLGVVIKSILSEKSQELIDYPVETSVPCVPAGWAPVAHKDHGVWKWNPDNLLVFSVGDATSLFPWYRALYYEWEPKVPYPTRYPRRETGEPLVPANSCLLDFFLTNRSLVKQELRDRYSRLLFMGTLYKDDKGFLCFRGIDFGPWTDASWREEKVPVDHVLNSKTGLVFLL